MLKKSSFIKSSHFHSFGIVAPKPINRFFFLIISSGEIIGTYVLKKSTHQSYFLIVMRCETITHTSNIDKSTFDNITFQTKMSKTVRLFRGYDATNIHTHSHIHRHIGLLSLQDPSS